MWLLSVSSPSLVYLQGRKLETSICDPNQLLSQAEPPKLRLGGGKPRKFRRDDLLSTINT